MPAVEPVSTIDPCAPRWPCGDGDGVHHADQVDVGRVHEVLGVRRGGGHRHDAGVGHDDVEAAEVRHSGIERFAQLGPLAHVGLLRHDATPALLHEPFGFGQVLGRRQRVAIGLDVVADVDGDDVRPLLCHADGVGPPLAAAGARDERHFPFESTFSP